MMNIIWFVMIIGGMLVAVLTQNTHVINDAVIKNTQEAVVFAIGLTGIMAVWLGLMNIAEKSGLIKKIGKFMSPFIRLLYPEIPKDHPAISSIVMNMVVNMFGAGNSATALGLKTMDELQRMNPHKRAASNSMCMFLVINMSSIQLIPLSVLKIRADAGSLNPTEIIGTSLVATTVSTIVGIITCKLLERKY
jgi:spore maturation protein A